MWGPPGAGELQRITVWRSLATKVLRDTQNLPFVPQNPATCSFNPLPMRLVIPPLLLLLPVSDGNRQQALLN